MSKAKTLRVFVPLTKVDEAQRLVYGRITQEILDKSGEVMDYDSSKPFFEKWSADIHDASGGLSKGNVRVMHGLSVAGKLTELDFNDDEKAIDVCAKIVDDTEWEKVTEGCYTGFSVGGKYEKRWTDTVDGAKIKKFTAGPNEVSLVDNPCVPTANFAMTKADGSTVEVAFKVENDDDVWPDFAKADGDVTEEPAAKEEVQEPVQGELDLPTNEQVVAKAEEIAKAAGDGSTWMTHVEAARDELLKAAPKKDAKKKDDAKAADKEEEPTKKDDKADNGDEEVTKADVQDELKQVWKTSDGKTFDKKADAAAHEVTLKKSEPTEADKLKARLEKALSPETESDEPSIMEDFGRLSKVISVLATPHKDGAPVLEKGMYTVSRFADILSSLGSLAKSIQREGGVEDDEDDTAVTKSVRAAISDLCKVFVQYADEQVTELMAGIEGAVIVEIYDYYCAAVEKNPDDQLGKDVCSVLKDRLEKATELRGTLAKAFGGPDDEEDEDDELNPSLQKRFDALEKSRDEFKKIAEDSVEAIEKLTKRVEEIADQPLPRAPRNPQLLPGDQQFFGKAVTSDAERVAVLKEMIETHGADGLATMMIKAAHASGGQQLHLKQ